MCCHDNCIIEHKENGMAPVMMLEGTLFAVKTKHLWLQREEKNTFPKTKPSYWLTSPSHVLEFLLSLLQNGL